MAKAFVRKHHRVDEHLRLEVVTRLLLVGAIGVAAHLARGFAGEIFRAVGFEPAFLPGVIEVGKLDPFSVGDAKRIENLAAVGCAVGVAADEDVDELAALAGAELHLAVGNRHAVVPVGALAAARGRRSGIIITGIGRKIDIQLRFDPCPDHIRQIRNW
mgnify:CR=1 FL=1